MTPEGAQEEYRIGIGYDIHPLAEGRRLLLGGVLIPHSHGLAGHSDADVLLHALCDALLGALSLGDIGELFPDTDPHYQDADSARLLGEVVHRVQDAGYRVGNADVTVIAREPRLASYRQSIVENVARLLHVNRSAASLKATTHEGLGSLGRGEGIAALAICLLRRAS